MREFHLSSAVRNLIRHKLLAAINLTGLGIALAAALLIALFVRDELRFDRFWPDSERIYKVTMIIGMDGGSPMIIDAAPSSLAARLREKLPPQSILARLTDGKAGLRHGSLEFNERPQWVDPGFFDIFPPTVVAGTLDDAISNPETAVLTRSLAIKFFGTIDALGQTLELNRIHPLRVAAIIEDFPANTHLKRNLFLSSNASFSPLYAADNASRPQGNLDSDSALYVKLPAANDAGGVDEALRALVPTYLQVDSAQKFSLSFPLVPLADSYFEDQAVFTKNPTGSYSFLWVLSAVGALIVAVAAINFITLIMAGAARRTVGIGVRKTFGASRIDLMREFLAEALLYSAVAIVIAFAVTELALPILNTFLDRNLSLNYGADILFICGAIATALFSALLAGMYPAVVLAGLRPVAALKSEVDPGVRAGQVRRWLVTIQFAVLIALICISAVIQRQMDFALNEAVRLDTNRVVAVIGQCRPALMTEIGKLPGVEETACSASTPVPVQISASSIRVNGKVMLVRESAVSTGFFHLYGLQPVAGRLFRIGDADRETDTSAVLINQTAVRSFGFSSPAASLSQPIHGDARSPGLHIVGVVPDFPTTSVRDAVEPTLFRIREQGEGAISIKLRPGLLQDESAATLQAIDRLWQSMGEPRPITRLFVEQHLHEQYQQENRQRVMSLVFSSITISIACLGLFGLSVLAAHKRAREVGIRKAMGAGSRHIAQLLLWDFSKPVLLANLIAWPVAYLLTQRWLAGFAYHVELELRTFVLAGAIALVIAWVTVSGQAARAARTKPVEALRHE